MKRTVLPILAIATALLAAGCGEGPHASTAASTAKPSGNGKGSVSASASASPSVAAPSAVPTPPVDGELPVLHLGHPVKWAYVTTFVPTSNAQSAETTTWDLTSVHWIPYAQAVAGGQDGDVAASLGEISLKPGDRYLVLGLTITDDGPQGFSSNFILGDASFVTVYRSGGHYINNQTNADCESQALPGATKISGEYASSICGTNTLQPGQSVTGYVVFEVPDTPSLLFVVGTQGTQSSKPVLAIDPSSLVHKSECDGTAAFC